MSRFALDQSPALVTNPPTGQVYRSYYFMGSVRIGMREFSGSTNVLTYLVTDHLGSTSLTLDASGVEVARMGYKPWGETRYSSGSSSTDYKLTGHMRLDIGIYFYGARNYDSTADYFANTFTAAAAGAENAPQSAVMWMAAFIDLTK